MKATLIINNKELEIEISETEFEKLQADPKEHTGYERVPENHDFYYESGRGKVESDLDEYCYIDDEYYESANYYSSEIVAENNARADHLMRQLRRFAVEHRKCGINLNDINTEKFYIFYDYEDNELRLFDTDCSKCFGVIYFDSKETAQAAIDKFHNELIWYFTEYKDSL